MCGPNHILDLTQKIGHTTLTVEWLLGVLKEKCVKYQCLSKLDDSLSLTTTRIGQNQGNNSTIYLISLKSHNSNKSLHYCLKTARSMDDTHAQIFPGMRRAFDASHNQLIHNRECEFYEEFHGAEVLNLPRLISCAKMRDAEDLEAHLLMEYLGPQASTIPLGQSFTREQVFSVYDQMARLHAFSLVNNNYLMEKFGEFGLKRKHDPKSIEIMEQNHQLMLKKLEQDGGDAATLSKSLQRLHTYMDRLKFTHFMGQLFHKEQGIPSVLVHGDLWGNNILMEQNENGFMDNVMGIIDWQFVGFANPCVDLARFFVMNVSPELRQQIKLESLKHYHEKLHQHYWNFKKSKEPLGQELFSFDQLLRVFEATLVSQLNFATFIGFSFIIRAENSQHKDAYLHNLVHAAQEAQHIVDEHFNEWNF